MKGVPEALGQSGEKELCSRGSRELSSGMTFGSLASYL